MILVNALMKSMPGVATRRREIPSSGKKPKLEYQIAFTTKGRYVLIFNGRSGAIRRVAAVDQIQTDWEPFQEQPGEFKARKVSPKL